MEHSRLISRKLAENQADLIARSIFIVRVNFPVVVQKLFL